MPFPKIAPNGGRVGLLQFTDDLLFFLCLNAHTILGLHRLLTKFEEEAGQRINRTKSQLLFSKNASPRIVRLTKDTLHIQRDVNSFDYLGTALEFKSNQRTS